MSQAAKAFTYGIALGAGVMFLVDPRQGGARRALIRDKSIRAVHEVEDAAGVGARDLAHRAEGLVARLRTGDGHVSDEVLVERVRSALGRCCSHPHAVQVTAKGQGIIELKGPILASDVDDVLSVVSRVRGIAEIDNDLEIHDGPGDVAALQGEVNRRRTRVMHATPTAKLVGGAASAVLALAAIALGHPLGLLLGGAGMLAFARSLNMHGSPLARRWRGRRQRIAVDRPRERDQPEQQVLPV